MTIQALGTEAIDGGSDGMADFEEVYVIIGLLQDDLLHTYTPPAP